MSTFSSREGARGISRSCLNDTLEQLISENEELRQTAANLVLQTAILRESLTQVRVGRINLSHSSS